MQRVFCQATSDININYTATLKIICAKVPVQKRFFNVEIINKPIQF